jgi:hypothetical protein
MAVAVAAGQHCTVAGLVFDERPHLKLFGLDAAVVGVR